MWGGWAQAAPIAIQTIYHRCCRLYMRFICNVDGWYKSVRTLSAGSSSSSRPIVARTLAKKALPSGQGVPPCLVATTITTATIVTDAIAHARPRACSPRTHPSPTAPLRTRSCDPSRAADRYTVSAQHPRWAALRQSSGHWILGEGRGAHSHPLVLPKLHGGGPV